MRPLSRAWIPLTLLWAATLVAASSVRAATCFSDPAVIGAVDVAFVGTLSSVTATGDQATLAVDDVWSSGDLPAVVVVSSATEQWSGASAGRYLVLASVVDGSIQLTDQECNVALPWDESFAALRPATAHAPIASTEKGGPPVQLLLAAGAMLVIGIASLIAFRRPRAPADRGQADG